MGSHSADSDGRGPVDGESPTPEPDSASRSAQNPEIEYAPDPNVFESPLRDELPPLSSLGIRPERSPRDSGHRVRPPQSAGRGPKKRRRGLGVVVVTGSVLVVAGALVGLWYIGQHSNSSSAFTAPQAIGSFLTAKDFPAKWEVGTDSTMTTPSALLSNDYWSGETVSDADCAAVDRSFGLLGGTETSADVSASSDQVINAGSAYSAQGQLVQQSARVFSTAQAASAFTTALSTSISHCSSYELQTSSGTVSQKISDLPVSGTRTAAVGFSVVSDSGDMDVIFLRRGNLVFQLMVGEPVSGDKTSVVWSDIIGSLDATIAELTTQ